MRTWMGMGPLALMLASVLSCSSTPGKHQGNKDSLQAVPAGKLTENIRCISDPGISYALYMPSTFSAGEKLPLFLAFDPHGSGLLPVKNYMPLAEKYRFILMGSNDSKNNQTMEETGRISEALFREITSRIPADPTRIYLTGFSGGSRVASILARYQGGVRGVIGCGAGFAAINQPASYRFDYFGLAGNADFNMQEMIMLDQELASEGMKHSLLIFKGKHEWPAPEVMEMGFRWILGDTLDPSYKIKIGELVKSGVLIPKERFGKEIRDKELKIQQDYMDAFYKKDFSWWKKQVAGLQKTAGISEDVVAMNQRVLSFLSLACYSQASQALAKGDKSSADYAIKLYGLVDPDNPAVKEMKSQLEKMP